MSMRAALELSTPASAAANTTVAVTATVTNLSIYQSWTISVAGTYNDKSLPFLPAEQIIGTLQKTFTASFKMPDEDVTIIAQVFYWDGVSWQEAGDGIAAAWIPVHYECPYCDAIFSSEEGLQAHIDSEHPEETGMPDWGKWALIGGGIIAVSLFVIRPLLKRSK